MHEPGGEGGGGGGSYTKNFLFIPWQDTRVTTE